MAVNTQKLLPGSTFSKVKIDAENIKGPTKINPSLNIYKKVVKIDKFFKNNLKLQSKEQDRERKDLANQKREKREKELETPKKFKGFEILKNALPKVGFLDSIKRFILFTFAGWLFTNLFQFLPKLLGFVKIITPVISWFEKGIGALFEGFVSFIDLGYKAYDSVRSFTKTIGGEKFAQKFDALSGALNTFLNLALIAGMSFASIGGFGGKGGKGGAKPKPGTGGRPRVTTSGGGAAGRPSLRNPLRQKPSITGGTTGRPSLRNPLRQKPRITGSGGKVVGKGIGKFAGKIPFVGPLIDFGIRRLIFKEPLGKAAAGAVGAGAGQALGGFLGGSLGGIVGSVVPVAGTLLGAGAGTLIGSVAGGFIGDWIGTSLYDFIESQKDIKTKKMNEGGKVSSSNKMGVDGRKRRRKKPQNLYEKIQPGKDIGGEKEIEKIYPNPERKFFGITLPKFEGFSWTRLLFGGGDKNKTEKKKSESKDKIPSAINALKNVADALGKSGDWIGSLMRAGVQVALGQMPDSKNIARAIASVIGTASSPGISGIKALRRELFGFAEGGQVSSSLLSPSDTLSLERTIESSLRDRFDLGLQAVRKESKKRGPTGKDEMLEKNRTRAEEGDEGGGGLPGGVKVSGGNEDFWALVAIASREDSDPQAWADVAQSIYNRAATGAYGGGKSIKKLITASGQYEPTFANPKDWQAISDIATAAKASGKSEAYLQKVAAAILDPNYQKKSAEFIGGRTDFQGESQKGAMRSDKGDVTRGPGDNFFGWFYNARLKSAAKPPSFGKISKQESTPGPGKTQGKDSYDTNIGLGKGYGSAGSKIAGELGRYIKKKLKQGPDFQAVTEHPEHGGVVGGHSKGSYHYSGRAIDVGAWDYEQGKILKVIAEFNKMKGVKPVELLHAKNDSGHSDHVHVAYQGGGLVSPSKPNVPIPNSFASYNDPRKSSTLAVQPVIVEKMMPFPMDSPISFPSSGSSGVNNSMLPSLMQG